ncbi:conserved alanine and leucine rich membrane protein [Mycobacteroides abscessus subsp. abscessus]|nr:conserved alanine and leucine rich membrane protein [Mycobacteroides abscessus subsp. abscessus]
MSFALVGPALLAITSVVADRSRIPAAILAFAGVASVHTSGAIVVVVFAAAWWVLAPLAWEVDSRHWPLPGWARWCCSTRNCAL